ncbi:ABC transporter permease [Allokutzneria multivorans]|uniref:ABC transporter permease n=1 Tax=Allokutzneria multivorans TaxID=1142134 RepID=A0ABP7RTQ6_9PSEU
MRVLALGGTELKLLWRNRTVMFMAIAFPLGLGGYMAYQGSSFGGGGWGVVVTLQIMLVLLMTVYITITTTLTARRQDLFLKRLRSGELTDFGVLAGTVGPVLVLGFAQSLVLAIIAMAAGAPIPANPLLFAAGVLIGLALFAAAGMASTVFTKTPENAQLTTLPIFMVAAGAAASSFLADNQMAHWISVALPGGGIAEMLRTGWLGVTWDGRSVGFVEQLVSAGPAAGASLLWAVLAVYAALRWFRWEPRS